MAHARTLWLHPDLRGGLTTALAALGFRVVAAEDARVRLVPDTCPDAGVVVSRGSSAAAIEEVLLQRVPELRTVALSAGVALEVGRAEVVCGDRRVRLTPTERKVVLYLWGLEGQGASAEQLLQAVWAYRPGVRSRTVISTVHRLRRKLGGLGLEGLVQTEGPHTRYRLVGLPSPVLGRAVELAQVESALGADGWTVLVGPGGAGKSHLARAVLQRWSGPTHVACAEGTAADLVAAVGRAWGVALAERPLELLLASAATRAGALLLIEDAESAPEAVSELMAALREVQPGLCLLACSRRALAGTGSHVSLGPLPLPAARALFLGEAQRLRPELGPSEDLDELLLALDRLPLALRLVAATAGVLTLPQMVERIDQLVGRSGDPTSPREVVAATVAGLDADQRAALGALAQFPGAFSVEDAEAVLGSGAVEALGALRVEALLESAGEGLTLLALVRGAAEPPTELARSRFVAWAHRAPLPERVAGVYAAWRVAHGEAAEALAARLAPCLLETGPLEWTDAVLDAHPERVAARLTVLYRAGRSAQALDLLDLAPAAEDELEDARRLQIASRLEAERAGPAAALHILAPLEDRLPDLPPRPRATLGLALAQAEFENGLLQASEARTRSLLHDAEPRTPEALRLKLHVATCAARRAAPGETEALAQSVREVADAAGWSALAAEAVHLEGVAAHLCGAAGEALEALVRAGARATAAGRPRLAAQADADRGAVLLALGRLAEAEAALRQSISLTERYRDRLHHATTLGNLMALLTAQDRWGELGALLPRAREAAAGLYSSGSTLFHEATWRAHTGDPEGGAELAAALLPSIEAMGRGASATGIRAIRAGWLLDAGHLDRAAAALAGLELPDAAVPAALVLVVQARLRRARGTADAALEARIEALPEAVRAVGAVRRALQGLDAS